MKRHRPETPPPRQGPPVVRTKSRPPENLPYFAQLQGSLGETGSTTAKLYRRNHSTGTWVLTTATKTVYGSPLFDATGLTSGTGVEIKYFRAYGGYCVTNASCS